MDKLLWIQNKILTKELLMQYCLIERLKAKKIVFTNGCFDILHYGHIRLLTQAAQLGHKLIVGLNSDNSVRRLKGSSRPVNAQIDRAWQLASMLVVDAVCIFDEDTPLELIKFLKPDVLVKGGDYSISSIVGATEVVAAGGKVEIIPFENGYSTSSIINKITNL